ncbi:MAG: response regulator transcription factor [Armatimonadota bacterium]
MTIEALLADDQDRSREATRHLIENAGDIEVVGEASNGREAVKMTEQLGPDVVIMDISMPVMNGLQATQELRDNGSNSPVLILSIHTDHRYISRAKELGACGYVVKDQVQKRLIEAIRTVADGKQYFTLQ